MQVEMEHLLKGSFAISDKHVDAFTRQPRSTDCRCYSLGHCETARSNCFRQICEIGEVLLGNNEGVPRIDWTTIQEGQHVVVFVNDACFCLSVDDPAEHALRE
jgi:hypothetical protein